MGALYENGKRYPDLSPLSSPSKKIKTSSTPSILHRTVTTPRFPPLSPLRRPVHAPQRIIKAFGLGSTGAGRKSRIRIWARTGSVMPVEPVEDLGLEDYRRLVVAVKAAVKSQEVELPPAPEVVDLRDVDLEANEEATTSTPMEEVEKFSKRRVPLCKELYMDLGRKHNSRFRDLEFEVKSAVKRILGFRLADELLRKKHTKGPIEPFIPLTDEDEQAIGCAVWSGERHVGLVMHKASNIEITRKALGCLKGNAWLNDEVINLYIALLKEREGREPKKFLKCHFFNTFFYKKLTSGRNGYDYKAVKRWTAQKKLGYNLIDCDKIFVPIHKDVHWCLAIINLKDKKFQYLDSLGGMDRKVLGLLARYFKDEVNDKSNKQIGTTSWRQETVDGLPSQENGWDCGMFMLKYMDFYCRGLNLDFGQEHMSYFRRRTALEILKLRAE